MKILGLLRHAKSDWDDVSLRDFDRGLNKRGRKGARLIGRHIAEHGIRWDKAIASTARRVVDTLEASELPLDIEWHEEAYLAPATELMDMLRRSGGDAERLLLVGHNPGLQELIFALVAPDRENAYFDEVATKYPTAAYCVLELDIGDWSEINSGCGHITHLARPRDLDPALGPEVA